jgi:hypothetical protein
MVYKHYVYLNGLASRQCAPGVEHCSGMGVHQTTHPRQTPNTGVAYRGSKTMRDNLRGQEGNSPDRQPRPLNVR